MGEILAEDNLEVLEIKEKLAFDSPMFMGGPNKDDDNDEELNFQSELH